MDPITKALVETIHTIITEANDKDNYNPFSKNQDDGWKPKPPKRGVTKDGKIITINDPGYRPQKGREHIIDGSGRRNRWVDQQGNIRVTYGITDTPPPGMKHADSVSLSYIELGDDYKEGDNLQDYYNKKNSERNNLFGNKPTLVAPTPGKTPFDDRAGDAPTPAKTPYSDRAGYAPEPAKTPYSDRAGAGGLGGGYTGKLGSDERYLPPLYRERTNPKPPIPPSGEGRRPFIPPPVIPIDPSEVKPLPIRPEDRWGGADKYVPRPKPPVTPYDKRAEPKGDDHLSYGDYYDFMPKIPKEPEYILGRKFDMNDK